MSIVQKINSLHCGAPIPFEPGEIIYHNLTIQDLTFSTDNFPNISSSTSAHPLAVLIGCKILNISYVWTNDISYPYNYQGILILNYSYLNLYQYPYFGYVKPENFIVDKAEPPRIYRLKDDKVGEISFELTEVDVGGTSIKSTFQVKARTLIQDLRAKMPVRVLSAPDVCPSCGKKMMPDFKMCPFCSTKLV